MRIYKVEFNEAVETEGVQDLVDYEGEVLTLAATDAEDAIDRVRNAVINATRDWTDDDCTPPVKHHAFVKEIEVISVTCTGKLDL